MPIVRGASETEHSVSSRMTSSSWMRVMLGLSFRPTSTFT